MLRSRNPHHWRGDGTEVRRSSLQGSSLLTELHDDGRVRYVSASDECVLTNLCVPSWST